MKRAIFIGQAMPRIKRHPHDWPSLNTWLSSIGIGPNLIRKYFLYSALVDYFPGAKNGSHIIPSREQIARERKRLVVLINNFRPEIVIPIGRLSIAYCLGEDVEPLEKNIGKIFRANPYQALKTEVPIIPLPHPSGASTWRYQPENKQLLLRALSLLKDNLTEV